MYEPPAEGTSGTELGKFTHPYSEPQRHMPPCNWNTTCNMSPVIPDFLQHLSLHMQNAQVLEHMNGLAKYVCKYITQVDEGNYVIICVDVDTGQWVMVKTHLHNTKIVSSKINEDAKFMQQKFKYCPKGRANGYFELRQFAMGQPKVLTNLDWLELSILPFELRPTSRIKLDSKGDVIENPADAHSAGIPMKRAQQQLLLREGQQMTASEVITYRNYHENVTKYCRISVFSLRPVDSRVAEGIQEPH